MLIRYVPTYEGLLTAVIFSLRQRQIPLEMLSRDEPLSLLPEMATGEHPNASDQLYHHLSALISPRQAGQIMHTVFQAWCAGTPGIALAITRYFWLAIRHRSDPADRRYLPEVEAVVRASERAGGQAHVWCGLLRFRELAPAIYLADFAPEEDLIPLILPHFSDRLPDQSFVIRDLRHHRAALHLADGRQTILRLADAPDFNAALEKPDGFIELWQTYLKHLTIPERRQKHLQQHHMPKKHWRFLAERPDEQ